MLALLAEALEEVTSSARQSALDLRSWHAGKQRLEICKGGVGEDGATERKTGRDAEELGKEHETDAVRHVFHLKDAEDDGEAGLKIESYASADEDLKSVQVGIGCRDVNSVEKYPTDKDAKRSQHVPGLVKRKVWKQGALQRNEDRRGHDKR